MKALLRELGYNWNGPACSFYDLLQSCKTLMYGSTLDEERTNAFYTGPTSPKAFSTAPSIQQGAQPNIQEVIEKIKDLFYATRQSMYELYDQGRRGQAMDLDGFKGLVAKYAGGNINEAEVQAAFRLASMGKDAISYQAFERAFKWELPGGGQWETLAVR